jgi:hypothetical protein
MTTSCACTKSSSAGLSAGLTASIAAARSVAINGAYSASSIVRRSPHRATTASTAVTAPGPDARASCGLCERRPSRLKRGALHTHLLLALLRAHGRRARRREAKATALTLGLQAIFVQPDGGGDNRTPALAAKEARAKRAVGLHEPYRVSERARHELGSVGVTREYTRSTRRGAEPPGGCRRTRRW